MKYLSAKEKEEKRKAAQEAKQKIEQGLARRD